MKKFQVEFKNKQCEEIFREYAKEED